MSQQPSLEARTESLIEALPYIQKFRGHTFVIKYGGSAMEDEHQVDRMLRDIVFLEAVGINPVVVHGGGKVITAKMRALGKAARFVNGLRVTDEESVNLVQEALDTDINPKIVKRIIDFGGAAKGHSGQEVFESKKLPPQPDEDGKPVDIGFVGEVKKVHTAGLEKTIHAETVPVVSPISRTADGTILNVNADVAAAALAAALKCSKLIFISDVPGIMLDPGDKDSLVPTVSISDTDALIKRKVIAGGMIPKVLSAVEALRAGVDKVHMVRGSLAHCLLLEIFTDTGVGTEIIHSREEKAR
ncbi:MAG: acetylglutamate kinase [Chthoniobacterales bacterium]